MSDTLIEALNAAGATSPDLHKIARTDIPPDQAIAELRSKYPGAFRLTFNARTASAAEYADRKRDTFEQIRRENNAAFHRHQMERLGVKMENGQ